MYRIRKINRYIANIKLRKIVRMDVRARVCVWLTGNQILIIR